MTWWQFLITTAGVLASLSTLVMLYKAIRRNPIKEIQELADAFIQVEASPPTIRPLARSQLLEAMATKFFSISALGWFLGLGVWVLLIGAIFILFTAPEIQQSLAGLILIIAFPAFALYVTRTHSYRQRIRTHDLLLAQSRAEINGYVEQHLEVDTRSMDERKLEEFKRKVADWIRTTKGAKEALLVFVLALLIAGMIGVIADFGWT